MKKLLKDTIKKVLGKNNPEKARKYISKDLGIISFFKILKKEKVNYSLLRWFEDMPQIEPGEDIDILVDDDHIEIIKKYLTGSAKDGIPCDIYSVSGIGVYNWNGLSYYPIRKAIQMLNNAIFQDGIYRVLSKSDHFYSLCYHALYRKGYNSGIRTLKTGKETHYRENYDHNYLNVLKKIGNDSNLYIPGNNLEDINEMLINHGWCPQMDTLEKLSKYNKWIKDHFFSNPPDFNIPKAYRGLSVYLIRELAVDYINEIKELITESGFIILDVFELPKLERQNVAFEIRGGNWSKGPYQVSGGLPAIAIVIYDEAPIVPNSFLIEQHIGLTNERVLLVKNRVRKLINNNYNIKESFNGIHSSDNASQALDYIKNCKFEYKLDDIKSKCNFLYESFKSPYNILNTLDGFKTRAIVNKIVYKEGVAICKLFKRNKEKYLLREVNARIIAKDLECMSELYEKGDNYIILKYYPNDEGQVINSRDKVIRKPIPIELLAEVKKIILFFRKIGYEYIDFGPHNILIDKNKRIKIIDFEFLQKTNFVNKNYLENQFLFDIPEGFNGDTPLGSYTGTIKNWKESFFLPKWALIGEYNNILLRFIQITYFIYFRLKYFLIRMFNEKIGKDSTIYRYSKSLLNLIVR